VIHTIKTFVNINRLKIIDYAANDMYIYFISIISQSQNFMSKKNSELQRFLMLFVGRGVPRPRQDRDSRARQSRSRSCLGLGMSRSRPCLGLGHSRSRCVSASVRLGLDPSRSSEFRFSRIVLFVRSRWLKGLDADDVKFSKFPLKGQMMSENQLFFVK
jgi:hypothetical protein